MTFSMTFIQLRLTPRVGFVICLTLFLFALVANANNIGASLQTLNALTPYSAQEPCASGCFYRWAGACSYDLIAAQLGCQANCISWASNDCYCRTDYQSIATAYLYSCVSSACTRGNNAPDISSATSLYNAYCTGLGYIAAAEATTTTNAPAATVTQYVTVTVTSSTAIRTLPKRVGLWAVGINAVHFLGTFSLCSSTIRFMILTHYLLRSSPSSPVSQATPFSPSKSTPTPSLSAQISSANAGEIVSSSGSSTTQTSGMSSVSSSSGGGSKGLSPGDIAGIASAILAAVGIVVATLAWRYPPRDEV